MAINGFEGLAEFDANHDGVIDDDQWGNAFRYESLVSIRNKSGHGEHKQLVYDIFFVSVSP